MQHVRAVIPFVSICCAVIFSVLLWASGRRSGAMPHLAGFVEGLQLSVLPGRSVAIDQKLIIRVDEDRRPALFNCDTE